MSISEQVPISTKLKDIDPCAPRSKDFLTKISDTIFGSSQKNEIIKTVSWYLVNGPSENFVITNRANRLYFNPIDFYNVLKKDDKEAVAKDIGFSTNMSTSSIINTLIAAGPDFYECLKDILKDDFEYLIEHILKNPKYTQDILCEISYTLSDSEEEKGKEKEGPCKQSNKIIIIDRLKIPEKIMNEIKNKHELSEEDILKLDLEVIYKGSYVLEENKLVPENKSEIDDILIEGPVGQEYRKILLISNIFDRKKALRSFENEYTNINMPEFKEKIESDMRSKLGSKKLSSSPSFMKFLKDNAYISEQSDVDKIDDIKRKFKERQDMRLLEKLSGAATREKERENMLQNKLRSLRPNKSELKPEPEPESEPNKHRPQLPPNKPRPKSGLGPQSNNPFDIAPQRHASDIAPQRHVSDIPEKLSMQPGPQISMQIPNHITNMNNIQETEPKIPRWNDRPDVKARRDAQNKPLLWKNIQEPETEPKIPRWNDRPDVKARHDAQNKPLLWNNKIRPQTPTPIPTHAYAQIEPHEIDEMNRFYAFGKSKIKSKKMKMRSKKMKRAPIF